VSKFERGDSPPPYQPERGTDAAAPVHFRPMLRGAGQASELDSAGKSAARHVSIPPPPDRVGAGYSHDAHADMLRELERPDATDAPSQAQPEHHIVVNREKIVGFLSSRPRRGPILRYPKAAVEALVNTLIANPGLETGDRAPLPPSEQVAYRIRNRNNALEDTVSMPNLVRHIEDIPTTPRIGYLQTSMTADLARAYGLSEFGPVAEGAVPPIPEDLPKRALKPKPRIIEVSAPKETYPVDLTPPPEPIVEHHPVVTKDQLLKKLTGEGPTEYNYSPRSVTDLLKSLAAYPDLGTFGYEPLPPSERVMYTISNRQGELEEVVSLPNIARKIGRVYSLPGVGDLQAHMAEQIVEAYEAGEYGIVPNDNKPPGKPEPHPMLDKKALDQYLGPKGYNPQATGKLLARLSDPQVWGFISDHPIPFSEQPAYKGIEDRRGYRRKVISLPNLARHADDLRHAHRIGAKLLEAMNDLIAGYEQGDFGPVRPRQPDINTTNEE
jgi:hypothetical protein